MERAGVCIFFCALAACGARSTLGVVVGKDAGVITNVDASTASPKRVFVTHGKWDGDLVSAAKAAGHPSITNGLDAADALCNDSAKPLGGRWVAWISDGGHDAIDRIADVGPWHNLDGDVVFVDKAQLATNPLAAILRDETGGITDLAVWTGTLADGRVATQTCNDWSSNGADDRGMCGLNNTTTQEKWSEGTIPACSGAYDLYCFEQ